jgi:6-phosphofructokinase
MTQRIGIVTGGGDCPGLNAVIRAVAKAAAKRGWETIGFLSGYEGVLEPQRYMPLDYRQLGSLLTKGGTIRQFLSDSLLAEETISPEDLLLYRVADTADDALAAIRARLEAA